MEVKKKTEDGCVREFDVLFSAEEVAPERTAVAKVIRGKATLKGFRPGKAPLDLIQAKFRKEILEEVLERILPKALDEAVKQVGEQPVGDPNVQDIETPDGGVTCVLHLEVEPKVPRVDDLELEIDIPRTEPEKDSVERNIEGLRQRASTMLPVEGVAEEGDLVEFKMTRTGSGGGQGQDLHRMASETGKHPLDRALFGRKAEETFELAVEKEEGGDQPMAPGTYQISVTRVTRIQLPESDEELAKHYGKDSIDELRKAIEEEQTRQVEERVRKMKEDAVVEALLRKHAFSVPPTLIERQLSENMKSMGQNLASKGVDPSKLDVDWNEVSTSMRKDSEKQVSSYFLLDALAIQQGLSVSEQELSDFFKGQAKGLGDEMTPEKLRKAWEKERGLESLRTRLLHQKVLDLLVGKAKVTIVEGPPEGQEERDADGSDRSGADE